MICSISHQDPASQYVDLEICTDVNYGGSCMTVKYNDWTCTDFSSIYQDDISTAVPQMSGWTCQIFKCVFVVCRRPKMLISCLILFRDVSCKGACFLARAPSTGSDNFAPAPTSTVPALASVPEGMNDVASSFRCTWNQTLIDATSQSCIN